MESHRPGVGYTDNEGVVHYCAACQQDWENRTIGCYRDAHGRQNYGLAPQDFNKLMALGHKEREQKAYSLLMSCQSGKGEGR